MAALTKISVILLRVGDGALAEYSSGMKFGLGLSSPGFRVPISGNLRRSVGLDMELQDLHGHSGVTCMRGGEVQVHDAEWAAKPAVLSYLQSVCFVGRGTAARRLLARPHQNDLSRASLACITTCRL